MDSRWTIYGLGGSKRAEVHELEYHGAWMEDEYVSVTIKSESPVNLKFNDYLMYRGTRFEINYDPNVFKKSSSGTYGEGFVYDGVKLYSEAAHMKRMGFRDYVLNWNSQSNKLVYSSQGTFSFFAATIDDFADRLQANLNRLESEWMVFTQNRSRDYTRHGNDISTITLYEKYYHGISYDGSDSEAEKDVNVSVDNVTCWDALKLAYTQFGVSYYIKGKHIVIEGAPVDSGRDFGYGKGNGLYEIERTTDDSQRLVTKLFAYGSEKNIPTNYYANLHNVAYVTGHKFQWSIVSDRTIYSVLTGLTKDSVSGKAPSGKEVTLKIGPSTINGWIDYRHGVKSIDEQGSEWESDPESEEYLRVNFGEGSSAESFMRLITNDYTRIYFTSGINVNTWPNVENQAAGQQNYPALLSINRLMLPGFPDQSLYSWVTANGGTAIDASTGKAAWHGYTAYFSKDGKDPWVMSVKSDEYGVHEGTVNFDGNSEDEICPTIEGTGYDVVSTVDTITDNGYLDGDDDTFELVPAKVNGSTGDIEWDYSGDTVSISMKDGPCVAREFVVKKAKYKTYNGSSSKVWVLTLERSKDSSLGVYFPYRYDGDMYQVKSGNHFVVLGIPLPKSYVDIAAKNLLEKALKKLSKTDHMVYTYIPKIDEIEMAREHDRAASGKSLHDNLFAGMQMTFHDDNLGIEESPYIGQLTIKENGNNGIPTYDVVLRDEKEETFEERIISRVGGSGSSGSSGGSTKGGTGSGSGISEEELEELMGGYVTTEFFEKLFSVHKKVNITEDITEDEEIEVNGEIPEDGELSIESKMGLWTEQYLSALGTQGDEEEGFSLNLPLSDINKIGYNPASPGQTLVYENGGWTYGKAETDLSAILYDINSHSPAAPGVPTDGQTIVFDGQTNQWGYGSAGLDEEGLSSFLYRYNYLPIDDGEYTGTTVADYLSDNNYLTQTAADGRYVKIDFFNKLFRAQNSGGDVAANADATITSIKAMVGLWTDEYLSALGTQGSGSGDSFSLYGVLKHINEHTSGTPTPSSGDTIIYSNGSWGFDKAGVDAASVQTAVNTALSGKYWWGRQFVGDTVTGDMSSVGDITFSASGKSIGGMLRFDTASSQIRVNDYQATDGGVRQFTYGNGTFTPRLYVDGNIGVTNFVFADGIELHGSSTTNNVHGGHIDFHYNKSTLDFTSRIIELSSGVLSIMAMKAESGTPALTPSSLVVDKLYLYKDSTNASNDVYFVKDSTGVKLVGAGFYTDSFISALGTQDGSSSGIDLSAVWGSLESSTDAYGTRQVNLSHLANMQIWVNSQGFAKTANVTKSLTIHQSGKDDVIYNGTAAKEITISSGGGVDMTEVWNALANNDTSKKINSSHFPSNATLSTYNITDAKIVNGTITLGVNSITPITSYQTLYTLSIYGGTTKVLDYTPNSAAMDFSIVAGSNISLTNDISAHKITIANTYSYNHPTDSANTTITAESGKVLSAITVNSLGHVTSVSSKTLVAADIPSLTISKISDIGDARVIYATSSGSCTGNAATATRLQGADTKTIWGQNYWVSGVPQNVSGRLSLAASDIYWKENNYGDQFAISPTFNGTDDDNKLRIMSAVGTQGTTPDMTTKVVILGKSGSVGIGTESPAYKLDVTGNIRATQTSWFPAIELFGEKASDNIYYPYIDFHYNNSTSDFTTRIIENTSGVLSVMAKTGTTGLVIGNSRANDYIKIGGATLKWTGTALEVDKDFYSTGAVSALGTSGNTSGGVGDVTWTLLASSSDTRQIAKSHLNVLNGYVTNTASENIGGNKTFTGSTTFNGTVTLNSNVVAYGSGGITSSSGFVHSGISGATTNAQRNEYVLLGGGGTKLLSEIGGKDTDCQHNARGTDGSLGWVLIARITVSNAYKNQSLRFVVVQRDRKGALLSLVFKNVDAAANTDVKSFTYDGEITSAVMRNSSNGVWDMYIQKSEAYDAIGISIHDKGSYMSGVTITWMDAHASSVPSSATTRANVTASSSFSIPTASSTTIGGIMVNGNGLKVESSVLKVDASTLPDLSGTYATNSSLNNYLPLDGSKAMTGSLHTKHLFEVFNGTSSSKQSAYIRFTRNGANGNDYAALGWNGNNVRLCALGGASEITSEADLLLVGNNGQLKLQAANGTSPITTSSTTLVSNLNADLLDGKHASEFALSSALSGYVTLTTAQDISGAKKFAGGITPIASGAVKTASGGGKLWIKAAKVGDSYDGTPNNGVVLEFSNTTSWTGQLYLGDNATQGLYWNGWSDGVRGTWKKIAFSSELDNYVDKTTSQSITGTKKFMGTYGGLVIFGGYASNEGFRLETVNSSGAWASKGITVLQSGNVGIGTDSPSQKLHVNGSGIISGGAKFNEICIECTSDGTYDAGKNREINAYSVPLHLQYSSSGNTTICYGGGNVGIGAYPNYKLDVNGTVHANNQLTVHYATDSSAWGTDAGGIRVMNTTGSNSYTLGLAATNGYTEIQSSQIGVGEKPLILNKKGGNVGIGTTSPNYNLDVNGSIMATKYYLHKASGTSDKDVYLYYDGSGGVKLVGAGFYTESFVSALGTSSSSSGSGVDLSAVWTSLSTNTDAYKNKQISASHLSFALSGFASQTWVQSNAVLNIKMNGSTLTKTNGVVDLGTIGGSDTKNTAGGDNTASQIYLVGMTSQTSNNGSSRTYTNSNCYASGGYLYSNSKQVWDRGDITSIKDAKWVTDHYTQSDIEWNNAAEQKKVVVSVNALAYWNGRYNANNSNLAYCNKGAFGSIVTKSSDDYVAKAGGSFTGDISVQANLTVSTKLTVSQKSELSGNVGIGVAPDSSNYKLKVKGHTYLGVDTYQVAIGSDSIMSGYRLYVKTLAADSNGFERAIYVEGSTYMGGFISDLSSNSLYSNFKLSKLYVNGNSTVNGTMYYKGVVGISDMRMKNVTKFIDDVSVERISLAPIFNFTWKDESDNADEHLGTSAQYWKGVLPKAVVGAEGCGMDYGATALASAVITARKVVDHEQEIKALRQRVSELEQEVEQLKAA